MWLSIIIPVYNAEQYLARCLDTVLAAIQKSGKKCEIWLINNNSTDNSAKIMATYREKWPKIVKIHACAKVGAAAARNTGVGLAKGEYLWFIDADDYIAPEAIKRLTEVAESEHKKARVFPDLIMLGAERRGRKGEKTGYLSAVRPEEADYKSRFVRYGMGPWQVWIRRKWWLEQGLAFREGMIHEDMELMSVLIILAETYAAVDVPLYYYCDNPESVLHKAEFSPKIFDIFVALEGIRGRFEVAGVAEEYKEELEWFFIWNLLIDAAGDFRKFPEGHVGFRQAQQLLRKYYPKWWRNRFLRQKPLKLQVRCLLAFWGI